MCLLSILDKNVDVLVVVVFWFSLSSGQSFGTFVWTPDEREGISQGSSVPVIRCRKRNGNFECGHIGFRRVTKESSGGKKERPFS